MANETYWDERYKADAAAMSAQNHLMASDFLRLAAERKPFVEALATAHAIIEVGCGTGELIAVVKDIFNPRRAVGIDTSPHAIALCKQRFPTVEWYCTDIRTPYEIGTFELAVCCHTLEHFKHPARIVTAMLSVAQLCMVIVPYEQPCTDGYDYEGGAGHVFTFGEATFWQYDVKDSFVFTSGAWGHSSKGEKPRCYAAVFGAKGKSQ